MAVQPFLPETGFREDGKILRVQAEWLAGTPPLDEALARFQASMNRFVRDLTEQLESS